MTHIVETFANPWFSATFVWREGVLTQIDLTADSMPPTPPRSSLGPRLEWVVGHYHALDHAAWPELPLNMDILTPFARKVLTTLHREVPRGSWTTYGQLAARCGCARGARAVGGVMARNPWPLYLPCHRVLAANMGLGGFGPGLPLKRKLLELEGVLAPGHDSGPKAGVRNSSSTASASSA
ncbi:MAG: MGMT family protein [Deltaproteobacteria bacterium]|nr:MGMT family protein [Deltaproteobacteria bacterium]